MFFSIRREFAFRKKVSSLWEKVSKGSPFSLRRRIQKVEELVIMKHVGGMEMSRERKGLGSAIFLGLKCSSFKISALLFLLSFFLFGICYGASHSNGASNQSVVKVESSEINITSLTHEAPPEYRIVLVKSEYRLHLFLGDQEVKSYPVAIGQNSGDKQAIGDMRTPVGVFKINEIVNMKDWASNIGDKNGRMERVYGPWFLSLATSPWVGIGIHGTSNRGSIGQSVSEGCIRMYNEDLLELKKFVKVGTVVEIVE